MIRNKLGRNTCRRSGYILYLVLTLLTIWGMLAISLSRYKSGSVNLLSRSSQQSRLSVVAQSGIEEIWSIARLEANFLGDKNPSHFHNLINDVFQQQPTDIPPKKNYVRERVFPESELPLSNQIADEITAGRSRVKGHCKLYLTKRIRKSPLAFIGHIEVVAQAYSRENPKDLIEIKERRDLKIIDTRHISDAYALYVKDFSHDYNLNEQTLCIEGVRPNVCSKVFLGSRNAPAYKAFSGKAEPAEIYLDINMNSDKDLIPLLLNNKIKPFSPGALQIPAANSSVSNASKGNVFWAVPAPVDFKPIFNSASFIDSDFYKVKALQDGYYKTFVETAKRTPADEYSVPKLILDDWQQSGGDYAKSDVFRMVVSTSIEKWKYLYGYTDVKRLWQGTDWTEFARKNQYSGLSEYLNFMKDFYPDKRNSGKMAEFFGENRSTPVIIEGNVVLRFFKLAFFDEFSAFITLAGQNTDFAIRSIPLDYQNPAGNDKNFLNKNVPVHGFENVLMSREVNEIPANSLFIGDKSLTPDFTNKPDNYYPYVSTNGISYNYNTPQEFIADRVKDLGNGEKCLEVDGLMFIEKGDLDLSKVNSFSGQGMIWTGFRGHVYLGDLAKTKPSDLLKIWAQDGSFIVKSSKSEVKIAASLIALTFFSDVKRSRTALENRGKFLANRHGVEILGNLIVDYLDLGDKSYGVSKSKKLKIIHDPFLFNPAYPKWTTIGNMRTIFAISADYDNRVIK